MTVLVKGTYRKYGYEFATLGLRSGEYSLTCVPERGGSLISFTKGDTEFIWVRDHNLESTERIRCGIPILFPSCSSPDNGVHVFNGKSYPMENHGFADLLPWEVKQADETGITLALKANGLTRFVYPFDFRLEQRYELHGNTAVLSLTVENAGEEPMPFSVGYHPYFKVSALDNVSFDIKAKTLSDSWKGEQPKAPEVITLPHAENGADNVIRMMTGTESPMVLRDSGTGHRLTVSFSSRFTNGVLWQQEDESFVCMEPWNGWANSLNEEGKHEVLNPKETMTFEWEITID